jgi:hypothetical protein
MDATFPMLPTFDAEAMRSITCVLLYGSRARGDHDAHSDVDLAAITSKPTPERVMLGRTMTTASPLDHALRVARSGGLFVYHLVSEAKVVFETEPVFARIQRAFRLRDDYTPVIGMCSDAGWFLVRHRESAVNPRKFNQAMAWCTREMLIARAANERLPVFSADGLADFVGCRAVASVIRSKRNGFINPATVRAFQEILREFGATERPQLPPLAAAEEWFRAARNSAGVIAVRAFRNEDTSAAAGGETIVAA